MRSHVIDELRPRDPEVDPEWATRTVESIIAQRGPELTAEPPAWHRPVKLLTVAATVAAVVGAMFVARELLPTQEPRPARVASQPDPGVSAMDEQYPTLPTDQTVEAVGTRELQLGRAPRGAYVFYKITIDCVDRTRIRFVLNGDRQTGGLTCSTDDGTLASPGELRAGVREGRANALRVELNHDIPYTVTVGYRTKSMFDVGPRGTLPDGRTYGPATGDAKDMPDLIRAVGFTGVEGYVDSDILDGPMPRDPAEALAQQSAREQRYRNGERIDRTMPVLDTTGRQVDVFLVMLPKPQ